MQSAPPQAQRAVQPLREPGDFRGTARMTDWSIGFDVLRLQDFPYAVVSTPGFWDSQNIDIFSVGGTFRLCAQTQQYGSTYASDEEILFYEFNNALYELPMANFVAADFKKITSVVGVPVKSALANIYPGAVAPRGACIWRDTLIVASGETVVRVMDTTETWTTIAAPGTVTAPVCGQVGVGQDDRLVVWWEGTAQSGLWAWEGTAWVKLFPTAGTTPGASSQTCDAIVRGAGSTLVFLRDKTGISTLVEIATQAAGTTFQTWLEEPGLRVWPQCADVYQGDVFIVGRLGRESNKGFLMQKALLSNPAIVQVFDTNFATQGQKGLDWTARCFRTIGDVAWIGGSSREDHSPAAYRFRIDPDNQETSLSPVAVINGAVGPIYSIGMLPPGGTGVFGTERLHFSIVKQTFFKDRDNDIDPTLDAPSGYIQFPDIDLGVEDHLKVLSFCDVDVLQKSVGGTIELQYRIDPQKLDAASSPWRSFNSTTTSSFVTAQGNAHLLAPDDNKATEQYGTRCRRLQLRIVMQRATSGLNRDVIDTVLANFAQILPLTAAAS